MFLLVAPSICAIVDNPQRIIQVVSLQALNKHGKVMYAHGCTWTNAKLYPRQQMIYVTATDVRKPHIQFESQHPPTGKTKTKGDMKRKLTAIKEEKEDVPPPVNWHSHQTFSQCQELCICLHWSSQDYVPSSL